MAFQGLRFGALGGGASAAVKSTAAVMMVPKSPTARASPVGRVMMSIRSWMLLLSRRSRRC